MWPRGAQTQLLDLYPRLDMPVLLLWADRDRLHPLASAEDALALLPDGQLHLTGLVARTDGSFLLKRSLHGAAADAARIGRELGDSLRADSPRDIFA